jgi:hypothetical protein
MKIFLQTPDLVEIGQNYWALYMKTDIPLIVAMVITSPKSAPF